MTGVVFVICASVKEGCVVVGIGGLSVTFTVIVEAYVPLAMLPEIVSEYDVFRYAPVTVSVDPDIDAEACGFVTSVYDVA